ncbi:ATP-binding protein [Streptomyces sp. NPDC094143]|uniref:ATP-binding protein n=1 Tax=Streptomyces sp. NPDC094143 TaxID=3155310 RepID=UPI003331BD04
MHIPGPVPQPLSFPQPQVSLGQRLRQTHDRAFVGRSAELALFRDSLAGEPGSACVLYLHGPGGVGKSTLLRRYADEAEAAGRNVIRIDARTVPASPAGIEASATGAFAARSVLLIDTFERCQGLETWLRDHFLPRLPGDTLVVIASRLPPAVQWRADPAWHGLLRTVAMEDLSDKDADALLNARGVRTELRPALLAFAGGHPLALALAAEVAVADTQGTARWAPSEEVLQSLLEQLVGNVPSRSHQRALEICAHLLTTTEELLKATFGDDARTMYDWLRRQPFIESSPHGLFPHDLVRDLLNTDLRIRDPRGWETMHREIRASLIERALEARGPALLPAMMALNYLHRNGEVAARFITWRGRGELFEDAYRPEDREDVIRLARQVSDPSAGTLAQFWLERQPEAFIVHRRPDTGRCAGFLTLLRLTRLTDDERRGDPLLAALWEYTERTSPLRPGEHVTVVRFVAQENGDPVPCPAGDLTIMRSLAEYLHNRSLAVSFVVLPNPDFWEPLLDYLDHFRLDGELTTAFVHDWRAVPRDAWLELCGDRLLYGPQRPSPSDHAPLLPRSNFDTAVRHALRAWHHETSLAANPLVNSRLVGPGNPEARVARLRAAIEQAAGTLSGTPRLEKLRHVVETTYFGRSATQEAAAARLNLPISTYRRYLAAGITHLTDELWRRQEWSSSGRAARA